MMRILFAVTLVLSSVNALIIPTTGGSKGKASRNPLSKAKRNSKKGEKYGLNADISSDWLDKYIVDSEERWKLNAEKACEGPECVLQETLDDGF